jgi:hypothetical protein
MKSIGRQDEDEQWELFGMRDMYFGNVGKAVSFRESQGNGESWFNRETGVFTVPQDGKYKFRFEGQSAEVNTNVRFRLNGDKTLASSLYLTARSGGEISLSATALLETDNTVSVMLDQGGLQGRAKLWVGL